MRITEIKHPSHSHTLKLKPPGEPYKCDGCKELGFGSYFGCKYKDCNFHLHEECATIDSSHSAFHPFFKNSTFHPQQEAFNRHCDACGKDILGYVYQCSEKLYDLHPCCLKLSPTLNLSGVDLQLVNKASKRCLKGWSYVSSCGDFCFHVACVKEMIVENYKRGYFDHSNGVTGAPSNSSALQIYSPGTEISRQGKSRKKAEKIWKITKMVFKLIVSAIFGDPTTGIAILIEALIS
ncbi:hypothetical protein UlMin_045612 [Ulmus minor]